MFKRTKLSAALVAAFGGGMLMGTLPAAAQQLERVEITGSSIKRVESEGALPVQIINRQEIERIGATSSEELLQTISASSSMGGTVNATGAGLSTYGLSSISLRGIGADRTLVLVNGRRLATFAGGTAGDSSGGAVNINAIPISAIERIEVLKDGASAIYGSDAIAGVVNFILKRDFRGIEVGAGYGQPTRSGGGKSTKAHVVAGFGDVETDRFNITLSLSAEKDTALFARDRNFARTGNVPPYILSGATGQGNIEGAYTPGTGAPGPETGVPAAGFGTSPGTGYGNPLAASNTCESINMFLNPDPTTKGAPFCAFDSNAFVGLTPKRDLTNLSANLVFKLTDSMELFGDAMYSESMVKQTYQTSPLRRSFLQTDSAFGAAGVDPALLIRPSNPNYAIAADYLTANGFGSLVGQPLAVTARVFDFGPRVTDDTARQSRLVAGLRGSVAKQDYEVAVTQGSNKVSGTVPEGHFSQLAFARAVNDPASDYNPWSLSQSAAFNAALAAAGAKYTGTTLEAESKLTTAEGKLSGELMQLPAGPALYAVGLQWRKESLVQSPSEALLSGDIAGLGGATLPIDVSRKVSSAYGEVVVPVVKTVEGTLQLRHDRYNDVGNSSNYKAGVRWQPASTVLVRGSVATGFRAPSLLDLHQPVVLQTSESFDDPATGQSDLQVNALTGGNTSLKPEKSRQRSIGIVLSPTKDFTVGIDYFAMRINDIIAQPSAQEVVSRFRSGDPAYAGLVTLTSSGDVDSIIQTLRNTGNAKIKGFDLDAAWRHNFGVGRLDLFFSGTYMEKFDQTSPGGVTSHKVGTIVDPNGDPVLNADNGGVVLRWKHRLSGTWSQGPWAFTLAQNFYAGYSDGFDLDGNPHRVGDQALYDAQLAFIGVKNLKLAVGVKNLFDKDPPLYIPVSNQFQAGYDITLYDPRSRFVYVTAQYKF